MEPAAPSSDPPLSPGEVVRTRVSGRLLGPAAAAALGFIGAVSIPAAVFAELVVTSQRAVLLERPAGGRARGVVWEAGLDELRIELTHDARVVGLVDGAERRALFSTVDVASAQEISRHARPN